MEENIITLSDLTTPCEKEKVMIENFFLWWFEEHYILSTIFTPFVVMLWCIFKGEFICRGLIALILFLLDRSILINLNKG